MTRELVFTEEEIRAMELKIECPDREVVCPRCGGVLQYAEYPTAVEVQCETENCLYAALRGI